MTTTDRQRRNRLAVIEGFIKPRDSHAHGTQQAAYQICQAIAGSSRFDGIDVFQDRQRRNSQFDFVMPRTPACRVFDKLELAGSAIDYAGIYVANGDQMAAAPYVLRPPHDWAPVICSVGTAHANPQWLNLFLSLASGAVRPTDGFIFKSKAASNLFRSTLEDWSQRFGFPVPLAGQIVIPNGVDTEVNVRSGVLRRDMRTRLRIGDSDVLFLSFSRLSPGTKGDHQALVVRWKQVIARFPQAVLALCGAVVDRSFVAELRSLARAAGVADRVLVVDNPYDLVTNARGQLMSAADVFVHLSTGVEETSSLVVHEAMAHSLPVITTAWAGMPEIVVPGENGYLVETRCAPVRATVGRSLFGQADITHLLAASRVVSTDWNAFLAAATSFADPDRRRTMGSVARRRAEAGSLTNMARDYLQFFDVTAERAAQAWQGPVRQIPLVDLDAVLSAQATRGLRADEKVRLGDPGLARLLMGGPYGEQPAEIETVLATLQSATTCTMGQLAAALAGSRAPKPSDGDGAVEARPAGLVWDDSLSAGSSLLVKLLNFGVLELAG